MRRRLLLALLLLAAVAATARVAVRPPAATQFQVASPNGAAPNAAPRFDSRFVSLRHDTQTHAASLIELRDGRLRAFWYAGSREGSEDVTIRSAVFDPQRGEWGTEEQVADRAALGSALARYVKKLGNPVPARAADGTLRLYLVTVSVGGWAGSSITVLASRDEGATWDAPQRLVTSPFLNISTLVKGAPFLYSDGTLGLPAYHEFINKFGELLHLDGDGRVIDKQRLSWDSPSLQPVVLVRSQTRALALLRNAGAESPRHVVAAASEDGGRHWTQAASTSLLNPDAAIAGVALHDGRLLVALNNIERNRDALSLALSDDGGAHWRAIADLEAPAETGADEAKYADTVARLAAQSDARIGDARPYVASTRRQMCAARCGFEFSYPYLIQTRGGDFELVYTWNRAYIKHVRFNRAWLEQRLREAANAGH